ncbi:MAG: hypothetical protein LBF60_09025 [Treponema sp.]|jgi:hypothetical protein|nr:hypothetical protein [Treponema sp.]
MKMKKMYALIICMTVCGAALFAQTRPGLYDGDALQGEMDIYDALDWIVANAQDGAQYTIVLGADQAIASQTLNYVGKRVTITLKSSGGEKKLTFASRSPSTYLFTVAAGVTLTLEDGVTLAGLQSASKPPIGIDGGEFIMNGGAVKDSIGGGVDVLSGRFMMAGGVDIVSGAFTMNDGVISGNTVGVYVRKDGVFAMTGGAISGNKSQYGGGVYVAEGGAFTMTGGAISGNSASYTNRGDYALGDGGGIYIKGGTFTMTGGTISGNKSSRGGGVHISRGAFTMTGGVINKNTAELYRSSSGGGVYVWGGVFTMSGGSIEQNSAGGSLDDGGGGGVYIANGTFTMNDGVISGNAVTSSGGSGGGVHVGREGKFTMTNGTITANKANWQGGGVHVSLSGRFTMSGGVISMNVAQNSGGGVCALGTFTKSGDGGVIYGSDAPEGNYAAKYGHAVHTNRNGSRDATARATMALDSTKQGAAGGWE